MRWLDGQIGSGFGGWMLMFLPLSALATAILIGIRVNPWLQSRDFSSRNQFALANLAKFVARLRRCSGRRDGALRADDVGWASTRAARMWTRTSSETP